MQSYDVLLRLSNNAKFEVNLQSVPAPEVMILNEIHGRGAVAALTPKSAAVFTDRDHRRLRDHIMVKYCAGNPKHEAMAAALFGTLRSQPLPEAVTLADLAPAGSTLDMDDEDPVEPETAPEAPASSFPASAEPTDDEVRAQLKESLIALGVTRFPRSGSIANLRGLLKSAQERAAAAGEPEQPAAGEPEEDASEHPIVDL